MKSRIATPGPTPVNAALQALGSKPAWIAIGVLLFNDNYLKFAFPSTITGKLSDIAELFVLPLAVAVVALSIAAGTPRRATAISAVLYAGIGVVFIAMKTDVGFAGAVRAALGPVTGGGTASVSDPTDLLALPALVISFAVIYRGLHSRATVSPRWRALPVLALVVFASVANTPGVPPNVQLLADPSHAGVFYAMYVDEDYYGGTYPRGIYRTTDAGRSWTRIANGAQRFALDPDVAGGLLTLDRDTVSAVRGDQANTTEASATSPSTHQLYGTRRLLLVTGWPSRDIFIARDTSLLRSQDRGSTWVSIRETDQLRDIAAATVEGLLYAIQSDRTLTSTDHGATWSDVGRFPSKYVRLGVDPRNADHVVAATNDGIYITADGGRTWRASWNKKTITYRRDFSASVVFDPDHPERVYATLGTDVGLLVSGDGGATWGESELPALSVAVGREPGPRVFIHADYRGVFHESRPWPELEPWTKVNVGLPFR
jgi:photosystem II stability/assembly factor-like uncharacterized protein